MHIAQPGEYAQGKGDIENNLTGSDSRGLQNQNLDNGEFAL